VLIFIAIVILAIILLSKSCNRCYNTVNDSHFNCDGTLIIDSTDVSFRPTMPAKIKFFVEVSGNAGFFRKNKPTQFKEDVYQIMSYYNSLSDGITFFSDKGEVATTVPLQSFRSMMNTCSVPTSGDTHIPKLIHSMINSIDTHAGEVAVLISDMKFDPTYQKDKAVLITQYSTDISKIFGDFGQSVCLIGATSDYLDKSGNLALEASPYYFLVVGKPEHVAEIRNGISTLLENNGHFIDNIETGFTYGTRSSYSFGIPENCYQLDKEPTFVGYEPSINDTCVVKLKVNLENYRWRVADENVFREIFKCKTLYGSEIQVGDVNVETKNIVHAELNRKAVATVDLKIFNMPQESDVIEWTIELPDLDVAMFSPYFGAMSENDPSKTYSLENFLKGMFYGGVVNDSLKPNYFLVSKKS